MTKRKRPTGLPLSAKEKAELVPLIATLPIGAVSAKTGRARPTLLKVAREAGVKPIDGRRSRSEPPPPAATVAGRILAPPLNGASRANVEHADGGGPRLSVHGLQDYLRRIVREELRPLVRDELSQILSGLGKRE
jgi:hypothetical protein